MSPQDIIEEAFRKGVTLRVNAEDGKLTATPLELATGSASSKLGPVLLEEIRLHRAELIEYLDSDKGEIVFEDLTPEPPLPSLAEKILTMAAGMNVTIDLSENTANGRLRITTPLLPNREDHAQCPHELRVAIHNNEGAILDYLMQPFLPTLKTNPNAPKGVWDNLFNRPGHQQRGNWRERQRLTRELMIGGPQATRESAAHQAALEGVLPATVSPLGLPVVIKG